MRRLVNKGSTTAWSSTLTRRTAGTLRAATATETASSGIALAAVADRQHPHPGAARVAGTFRTCSPSPTSRWANSRPTPGAPPNHPAASRPAGCPLAQLLVAVQGGGDVLLVEQLAVLVGADALAGRPRCRP